MNRLFIIPVALLLACSGSDPASTPTEETAAECSDAVDNDDDGFTDCDDYRCWKHDFCDETDVDTDTGFDTETSPGAQASGVTIDGVDIYQSLRVPLMVDFQEPQPGVPLIPGKPALIRVFLTRDIDWTPRKVWVHLDLNTQSGGQERISEMRGLYHNSSLNDFDSTINFYLTGEQMASEISYSVTVQEVGSYVEEGGDTSRSRWPEDGSASFQVDPPTDPLKLVIVPVRYNADGSGRLPNTSPSQLDTIREAFKENYPIAELDITVAPVLEWDLPVLPDAAGWSSLLNAITDLRSSQGAQDDVYYYGLFAPADSFYQFCGSGCVAGLSHLCYEPEDAWSKASIGLGYGGESSAQTMVHEVGHAHGRWHAPCGNPAGIDEDYPHPGGFIGTYGLEMDEDRIISALGAYDFMSYCNPTWVSDYTYNALYERILAVNNLSKAMATPASWRTIILNADGTAESGATLKLHRTPSGTETQVRLLDKNGKLLRTVTGYFNPVSDNLGGTVLFQDGLKGVAKAAITDFPAVSVD